MTPRARVAGIGAIAVLAAVAHAPLGAVQRAGEPAEAWRTFEGSWSAVGRIQTVPTEGASAAVVQLSGVVSLKSGSNLGAGFHGEAIAYEDGSSASAGRASWTDSRGDRVYSAFKGEPLQTGRRVVGTITGGTGRYAGVVGDYELTWQYVVSADDGVVQGRAADLRGRFRTGGGR